MMKELSQVDKKMIDEISKTDCHVEIKKKKKVKLKKLKNSLRNFFKFKRKKIFKILYFQTNLWTSATTPLQHTLILFNQIYIHIRSESSDFALIISQKRDTKHTLSI